MEKSQTNVTSVILHPLGQVIWVDIWKNTVEKSQTEVTHGKWVSRYEYWIILAQSFVFVNFRFVDSLMLCQYLFTLGNFSTGTASPFLPICIMHRFQLLQLFAFQNLLGCFKLMWIFILIAKRHKYWQLLQFI